MKAGTCKQPESYFLPVFFIYREHDISTCRANKTWSKMTSDRLIELSHSVTNVKEI